ncbi:MAG: response regulator transcription factor [Phycisphaeraceae bacterium]|nr:response regulator transcription factor [Phycisphaeraceae bacterium]
MNATTTDGQSLLIVEDEPDLLELLRFNLDREGFEVHTAETGEDGLKLLRRARPNLMVLDLMLPGMDGLEVCRQVRQDAALKDTSIIMLTAKGEESDIVRGLEMGADDYVTKPFSPRVLVARIQSVLRRVKSVGVEDGRLRVANVTLDQERHEVTIDGQPTDLTATEFKLLHLMMKRPGRVYTRQQIIEGVHEGFAAVTDRSVDVQVVALRKKLGAAGRRIETVRGVGYRFRE